MQTRVRKKRSLTRVGWTAGTKTACFLSVILLYLGLLSGCATRKIKNPSLIKSIDSICLTGQGKGRIEYAKGRHVFDYESLWEPKKDKWSLALGLPLIGQELLALSLKGKSFDEIASGTFAKRLKNENKSPRTRKLLGDFFSKFTQFLEILKNKELPKGQEKEDWVLESTEDDFIAQTSVGVRYVFHMKAFQWDDYYQRLRVSLNLRSKKNAKEKPRTLLKLDLFVSACNLE